MRLEGKVAVVTGGTQGIGRGISRRFAAEGAAVVLAGRNEHNGQAVESEIRAHGGEAVFVRTDVRVAQDVEAMVTLATERYGQLDVLVNNAGVNVAKGTPFFQVTQDQWQRTIDVNLLGTFLCSRAAARHMIERRQGCIIHITSVHGQSTATGNAAYATSKGGLILLTKAMAIDLAPFHIRVNAIAPGAIALEHAPEEPGILFNDFILAGRWGTVDDIAAVAVFLSTEEASYINGETITVDGGLMALLPGKPVGTP